VKKIKQQIFILQILEAMESDISAIITSTHPKSLASKPKHHLSKTILF
jgi:hypothetical protein